VRKTPPAIIVVTVPPSSILKRGQVVPLSSRIGKLYPSEAMVAVEGRASKAMGDQLTTVSKKQLTGRIGSLISQEMRSVEITIRIQLALAA
jgi:mRNA interferase MazF